jgi:hypothetical protein
MHRKAEEEGASSANGDDDNAARRRPGLADAVQYFQALPLVSGQRGKLGHAGVGNLG